MDLSTRIFFGLYSPSFPMRRFHMPTPTLISSKTSQNSPFLNSVPYSLWYMSSHRPRRAIVQHRGAEGEVGYIRRKDSPPGCSGKWSRCLSLTSWGCGIWICPLSPGHQWGLRWLWWFRCCTGAHIRDAVLTVGTAVLPPYADPMDGLCLLVADTTPRAYISTR